MVQKKRGPGRPKWVVKRQEVQHSKESARVLEWWQFLSREEGGAAMRRALVVLYAMRANGQLRHIERALKETER